MMCARCEELEEEVAYLKSELGLIHDATLVDQIKRALGIRPGPAHLLMALYRASPGRTVSRWHLLESLPPADRPDDSIVNVYVCKLREALGDDAIVTVWGTGYRLADHARARVAALLNPASQPGEGAVLEACVDRDTRSESR
jgi:DNA-binding winged helix-turn-helix (wHTH) protein